MRGIEYFYNIIHYFFYRAAIKVSIATTKINPFLILTRMYYNIPSVKKKFLEKGIDDPFSWHLKHVMKHRIVNPKMSYATIVGGGLTMGITFFTCLGIYHMVLRIFFPQVLKMWQNTHGLQ